ncbi:hypothetical protein J5N97_027171 [Dioscorea zingiberensis]|uniref:PB1 domain-containing protein n=1 Tax=Dioscorea zingiberensis TaxID=325984 RepID=A0A9D5H7E6_9LILI|nr:hypothetical protein J5N97_027171 [Dioscorea zingiberensis]
MAMAGDHSLSDPNSVTAESDHHVSISHSSPSIGVRLMCSFGGRILPRPHDRQLRYVGGETRIVAVPRHTSWPSLISKLSELCGSSTDNPPPTVKYQLPNEDLDALVSITSDEDLDNMMDEFDRLLLHSPPSRPPRLRLFLFPSSIPTSAASLGSILSSSGSKREAWFLDALNGGDGNPPPHLERGRSEASSVMSEIPDYLFGLEPNYEDSKHPGSPAIATSSSQFPSVSSSPSVPPIPDLPPVRIKPEPPAQPIPNPLYYMQEPVPVYYVPGNVPVPVQMPYGTVYVAGPAIGRTGVAGGFDYQDPAYPTVGVGQVGGDVVGPPVIAGQEMWTRRASQQ